MKTVTKKRIVYILLTIFLFAVEVYIAKYVNDDIIRPYGGDTLVVILLYTFVRIFIPEKYPLLSVYIFIFAVFVECMQYIHIVDILGIQNYVLRIAIGNGFSVWDIVAYAIGCAMTGIYEYMIYYNRKGK